MTQPKAFGGSAAGQLALCVARETLAAANPPFMDSVFGPSPGVLGSVQEPLATSHLAPLIAGEKRSSFGFTEPDDATPTAGVIDGDNVIINGQKSYVTGGADADFINAHKADLEKQLSKLLMFTADDVVVKLTADKRGASKRRRAGATNEYTPAMAASTDTVAINMMHMQEA